MLDLGYTFHKGAYSVSLLPYTGSSDHSTAMLIPAYRPSMKVVKPVQKQVRYGQKGPLSTALILQKKAKRQYSKQITGYLRDYRTLWGSQRREIRHCRGIRPLQTTNPITNL